MEGDELVEVNVDDGISAKQKEIIGQLRHLKQGSSRTKRMILYEIAYIYAECRTITEEVTDHITEMPYYKGDIGKSTRPEILYLTLENRLATYIYHRLGHIICHRLNACSQATCHYYNLHLLRN